MFLTRYLDIWSWFLWPVREVMRRLLPALDSVRIFLIGDIIKALILGVVLAVFAIYVLLFSFAPPVSYYVLGTAVVALMLRAFSRSWRHNRPILSAWLSSLSELCAWASIAFIVLTGVFVWLNFAAARVSPEQFASYEAVVVDATAALRRYVTPLNTLIALGVMSLAALLLSSFKPMLAVGAVKRVASALLSVFAVVASFTFVASEDTGARHTRIVGEIMPRLRSNANVTLEERQQAAALQWITADLSRRTITDRTALMRSLAELQQSATQLCAAEQAEFRDAYQGAMQRQASQEQIGHDPDAAASDYCNPQRITSLALRPLIRVRAPMADAEAPSSVWFEDLLAESSPDMRQAIETGQTPNTISIREARALDARLASAAEEATSVRLLLRDNVLDHISSLLGPEYRGVVGQALEALQRTVIDRLALDVEARFVELWSPRAPHPVLTDTPTADAPHHAELTSLSGAHGGAGAADDAAHAAWRSIRPTGGAISAAEAAAAAVISAAALRRADLGRPRARLPRIRF